MDALGFGLENYDGIGKWRTKDGKFDIDASGALPNGTSFQSPAGMRALLKSLMPEFSRCMIEKVLTYALGRGLERYDKKTVAGINTKLSASGHQFQSLIFEVVRSLPFQSRRGEVVASEKATKPKELAQR
jgi:hypothetical protein